MPKIRKPVADIIAVVEQLPPELQEEVHHFASYLLETRALRKQKKLRQDWAGALRHLRDETTSLELQKKALEWRDDDVSG